MPHAAEQGTALPVLSLGGAGLSTRQAARVLGVSHTTVERDREDGTTVPPDAAEEASEAPDLGTRVPAEADRFLPLFTRGRLGAGREPAPCCRLSPTSR
jgi:hypothetical protein